MVNIASGKHKLSHSVSLCFSYKSSGSSFSFCQILIHILALGSCLMIVFVGKLK